MDTIMMITKDKWDKAKIFSGVVASILIPAVLAFIGHWSSDAIKSREVAVRYTELALEILSKPAIPGSEDLREWSTEVISHYSGINMKKEVRKYLRKKDLGLEVLDEKWVPGFTDTYAKNIIETEPWEKFLQDTGDKQIQKNYIKILLNAYYEQVKIERDKYLISP